MVSSTGVPRRTPQRAAERRAAAAPVAGRPDPDVQPGDQAAVVDPDPAVAQAVHHRPVADAVAPTWVRL